MESVTINGMEYVKKHVGPTRKQIVVCHRGFVFIGDVQRSENEIVIHNAKNIRRWGTTSGLGQIAAHGPTDKTVLDDAGTVRLHQLAEVCSYDCYC